LAAGEAEAGAGVGGGEGFEVCGGQVGAAGEVGHVLVRAALAALVFDALGDVVAEGADRRHAEPHDRATAPPHGRLFTGLGFSAVSGPVSRMALASLALTSGRSTVTPWRRASSTRDCGE
jgi:hypothetical protein